MPMANLPHTTGVPIWANRFADLQLECGTKARTTIGIRDVTGRQQEFDSVKVWDVQRGVAAPGQTAPLTFQVSGRAERRLVIGGILAGGFVDAKNVQDRGVTTTVIP
jgi:hypothetical protein